MKRSRGRGRRQQNSVNRSYDSNGPDVRVRGNASQVYEKYQTLARDAMSSGDRVMSENYQQHAEHYYRILMSMQPAPSEANGDATSNGAHNSNDGAEGHGYPNGSPNGNSDSHSDSHSDSNEADGSGEPLVLVRDTASDGDSDGKPSKPSRRRGPLRKKRPPTSERQVSSEDVVVEAVEVIAEATVDASPEAGETSATSAE